MPGSELSLFNRYARFLGAVRDEFTFVSWRSAERAFEEAQRDACQERPSAALIEAPESTGVPIER